MVSRLIVFTLVSHFAYAQNFGKVQVSADIREQVIRSQNLGKKIFANDKASAAATDVLISREPAFKEKNIRGWITIEKDKSWLVRFIDDKNHSRYDVTLPKEDFKKAQFDSNSSGKKLTDYEEKMFLARQLASKEPFSKCAPNINTVVLDGKEYGRKGFLVYMLAASTNSGEIYFGGNHLFHISEDGKQILNSIAFTKSCITVSIKGLTEDQQGKGVFVSQIMTDYPTEIHVFLSFLHNTSIYVTTASNKWLVEEDVVSALEKR